MNQVALTNPDVNLQQTTGLSLVDSWNPNIQKQDVRRDYNLGSFLIAGIIMASGITPIQLPKHNNSSILQLCDFFVESPAKRVLGIEDDILIESPRIAQLEAKELKDRKFIRINDPRKNKSV